MKPESSTYAAAAMDGHARRFFAAAVVLCHALAVFLLWVAVTRSSEGPWYAWLLFGIAIVAVAMIPWRLLAGMPTEYAVDDERVVVRRRWSPSKSFVHQRRAERFRDADGLRRRRMYGSGSPTFSSILTATTDLPDGKVYFALTDRDRAVVVHRPDGPLLVSPSDVDGFLQAVNQA